MGLALNEYYRGAYGKWQLAKKGESNCAAFREQHQSWDHELGADCCMCAKEFTRSRHINTGLDHESILRTCGRLSVWYITIKLSVIKAGKQVSRNYHLAPLPHRLRVLLLVSLMSIAGTGFTGLGSGLPSRIQKSLLSSSRSTTKLYLLGTWDPTDWISGQGKTFPWDHIISPRMGEKHESRPVGPFECCHCPGFRLDSDSGQPAIIPCQGRPKIWWDNALFLARPTRRPDQLLVEVG